MNINKQILFYGSVILVILVSLLIFLINSFAEGEKNNSSNSVSSFSSIQNNSEVADFIDAQYKVKVGNFQFFYSPENKVVRFDGTVALSNGCKTLKGFKFEKNEQTKKYELRIEIRDTGKNNPNAVCTQIFVEAPIQGDKQVQLTKEELETFDSLFEVKNDTI